MNKKELKQILQSHAAWLCGEPSGKKADLSKADLHIADLSEANLRGANLREADLHGANLCGADSRGAYLCGAYLQGTKGIFGFYLEQHFGFMWKKGRHYIVRIGCKELTLTDWLKQYKKIGESEGYTKQQIKNYGIMLKALKQMKMEE